MVIGTSLKILTAPSKGNRGLTYNTYSPARGYRGLTHKTQSLFFSPAIGYRETSHDQLKPVKNVPESQTTVANQIRPLKSEPKWLSNCYIVRKIFIT